MQLTCYSAFVIVTYLLSVKFRDFAGFSDLLLTVWVALLTVTVISSALALAPADYWRGLLKTENGSILLAALAAILAIAGKIWLTSFTPALALATLNGTRTLLALFYDPVFFDLDNRGIGLSDFHVEVTNACAGYEGISMITVFLTLYLWLFRRDFRFPWALLAFPIGILVIWIFNIVRIAALITIGNYLSPEVAVLGFHSNAGWISFILVALGVVGLLHRLPFLMKHVPHNPKTEYFQTRPADTKVVNALLLPFIILLASSLLIGAISASFDKLYPIKVITTGLCLWYFRHVYNFSGYKIELGAVGIGVLVFIIWMLLVSASLERSEVYSSQFLQWPAFISLIWIVMRFLGSVVTVPLAEELAFRGYLLVRLGGDVPAINSRIRFDLIAVVASSLLFGLMHSNFLAGTLAGFAYAWVRYRRGLLADAVVAHVTTNFLLCLYVLVTQEWSYLG
jgi:exosortase E/protease (VPEID-CTERM system)